MMRIRSKRQRRVGFEALEGRLALSAGMGIAAASHHAELRHLQQPQHMISASFKGHVQVSGTTVVTSNLTGTIGPARFTGSGTGTVAGKIFQGGTVDLTSVTGDGTIQLRLGATQTVKKGRSSIQYVSVVVASATGNYVNYTGMAGTMTSWDVPIKPSASARFSGTFTA